MKYVKKMTAVSTSILMVASMVVPALAGETASEKEEVIYIMTDASGQVNDIQAVNIFAGGNVTDYGDYSSVKMLNTTDDINQNGDEITFSSDAEKVYYQGTMKTKTIPWNISIRYFLDGKEYSADEIAGKSGALEIHFQVTKNEECSGSFYENYALQASFTLDTDFCENIEADGATIANVGNDKQLTYTILPNKGIDTIIKADVTNFSMEAAAINGVKLSLNIDIDDSELMDKVNDIITAVSDLDDGATKINDGTGTLSDATNTLNEKVGELNSGVGSLDSGAATLAEGLSALNGKSDQLKSGAYTAYQGLCTAAATALNSQLSANGMDTISLTPENYSDVLMSLLQKMNADSVYQQAYQSALATVTAQVEAQADALYSAYVQSQASSIYLSYVTQQADTLYNQVAAEAVTEKLIESGYTEDEAALYLQSEEGQAAVAEAVSNFSDDQKSQILNAAVGQLSDEQKEAILQGAVSSLSDDQKSQIKNTYIQQMMASDDVTTPINQAVEKVSSAAKQVSELKGQLDSYAVFYQGLTDYTNAVGSAASGASSLKINMDKLYSSTGTLEVSVGELNDAVSTLYDGTTELSDGASEFVDKTSDMDTQVSDEIDNITSSITGDGGDVESFVSDKNTNTDAVQFVIKTAAVEQEETETIEVNEETNMTFWQKLLNLFGLYNEE